MSAGPAHRDFRGAPEWREWCMSQYCSGCHNFRTGGIGPQLGGLTDSVAAGWIHHFIKNPQEIIESGDERARQLFKKFKVAALTNSVKFVPSVDV